VATATTRELRRSGPRLRLQHTFLAATSQAAGRHCRGVPPAMVRRGSQKDVMNP
jgi:hypothetical protein